MNSYLASSSPRRMEILKKFGFQPISIPVDHDEVFSSWMTVEENCMTVAYQKARASYLQYKPNGLIIAGDTIVALENQVLNKPKDEDDARRMLNLMKGNVHRVISSFCLYYPYGRLCVVDYDVSLVEFREYLPHELEQYIQTKEYQDKAGAYGIQGEASKLIRQYKSSLYNIIGFPIEKMLACWEKVKVDNEIE